MEKDCLSNTLEVVEQKRCQSIQSHNPEHFQTMSEKSNPHQQRESFPEINHFENHSQRGSRSSERKQLSYRRYIKISFLFVTKSTIKKANVCYQVEPKLPSFKKRQEQDQQVSRKINPKLSQEIGNIKYYIIDKQYEDFPSSGQYIIEIEYYEREKTEEKKQIKRNQSLQIIYQKGLEQTDALKFQSLLLFLQIKRSQNPLSEKLVKNFKDIFKQSKIDPRKIDSNGDSENLSQTSLFKIKKAQCFKLLVNIIILGISTNEYQLMKFINSDSVQPLQLFSTLKKQGQDNKALINAYLVIADQKLKNQQDQNCEQINQQCYNVILTKSQLIQPIVLKKLINNQNFISYFKSIDFKKFMQIMEKKSNSHLQNYEQLLTIYISEKKNQISTPQLLQLLKLSLQNKDLSEHLTKLLEDLLIHYQSKLDLFELIKSKNQFDASTNQYKFLIELTKKDSIWFYLQSEDDLSVSQREIDIKKFINENSDEKKMLQQRWEKYRQNRKKFKFQKQCPQQQFHRILSIDQITAKRFLAEIDNAGYTQEQRKLALKKLIIKCQQVSSLNLAKCNSIVQQLINSMSTKQTRVILDTEPTQ